MENSEVIEKDVVRKDEAIWNWKAGGISLSLAEGTTTQCVGDYPWLLMVNERRSMALGPVELLIVAGLIAEARNDGKLP